MRVKKHVTGNQYLLTEDNIWVRNFVTNVSPLDINQLSSRTDYSIFLQNEIKNENNDIPFFNLDELKFNSAIIVSDGYGFKDKQKLLESISKDVAVIAVNRTLVKWNINRKIEFFLVNNPYNECMNFMPSHRYYPRCIVSTRTLPEFTKKYKDRGGSIFSYNPTPESGYCSPIRSICYLDDYRNPICASICLAYKLGVTKLLLFCCDDGFDTERPGSVQLENKIWTYPQHIQSQNIINGMLHWYNKIKNVDIRNCSSGIVYEDAPYIIPDDINNFFKMETTQNG